MDMDIIEKNTVDVTIDGAWRTLVSRLEDAAKPGDVLRFDATNTQLPGWAVCVRMFAVMTRNGTLYESEFLGAVIADGPTRVESFEGLELTAMQPNYGVEEKVLEAAVRSWASKDLMGPIRMVRAPGDPNFET